MHIRLDMHFFVRKMHEKSYSSAAHYDIPEVALMQIFYSTLALLLGYTLDLLIGDPHTMPHIIRAVGRLIALLERKLRRGTNLRRRGVYLLILTILFSVAPVVLLLLLCYRAAPLLGILAEGLIIFQLLSTKSLRMESEPVRIKLESGDLEGARTAVSMIVGRDTKALNAEGITKAAVETVAENTADGCVAPIFYIALGGAALGMFCKAVNTMDSMIGYQSDKYRDFGRAAAKLDDVVNYIPSRLGACLMICAARICGYDAHRAAHIWRRDRRKHASPNSAQTESALAGALGIALAGPACYFGVLHEKPTIGDAVRAIEPEDIRRAHRLLYATSLLALLAALALRVLLGGIFFGLI